MAIARTFRKGRAITGAQHRFATVFNQCQFPFEYIDEFVFMRMPVALARPIARRQAHEIDAEIREPAGIAKSLPYAFGTWGVELRWIARACAFRHSGDVDLRHGQPSNLPSRRRRSMTVVGHRKRAELSSIQPPSITAAASPRPTPSKNLRSRVGLVKPRSSLGYQPSIHGVDQMPNTVRLHRVLATSPEK